MDTYEKHANLYAAWVAMLFPCGMTICVLLNMNLLIDVLTWVKWLSTLLLAPIGFAAIGYYLREVFRMTSKLLFQAWLFKEDATKMPTTELLLWKNKRLSKTILANVRKKVKKDFGFDMMTAEQEATDEREARLNIVNAVGLIKKRTKVEPILLQANYRYGFWRNLLGGLVWALVVVVAFAIYNCFMSTVSCAMPFVFVMLIVLQGMIGFYSMKFCANTYAHHLIESYVSQ